MAANEYDVRHPHEIDQGIPPKLDSEGRCLVCRLMVQRDDAEQRARSLQAAVDRAYGALTASQYVGGPTEREAWQTAAEALAPLHTQHTAANPDAQIDERNAE